MKQTPFQDLLQAQQLSNGIPKIIHQTWKTAIVPTHWRPSQQAWKQLHTTWTYYFWTDETIAMFIQAYYPEHYTFFMQLEYPIQRVDLFRYFVLREFGGVYSDLDIMPVKSIDLYLSTCPGNIFLVHSANATGTFTNALMASCKSTSAKLFWTQMIEHVLNYPNDVTEIACSTVKHLHIMTSTGPLALTKVAKHTNQGISVLPRKVWNPFDLSLAGNIEFQQDAYNAHESIVRILHGSSWHSWDSTLISFLHSYKTVLAILLGLLCIRYFMDSELKSIVLHNIVARFKRLRHRVA